MPTGNSGLGLHARSEWVASIFAAVRKTLAKQFSSPALWKINVKS
jgi:hypothetical protein